MRCDHMWVIVIFLHVLDSVDGEKAEVYSSVTRAIDAPGVVSKGRMRYGPDDVLYYVSIAVSEPPAFALGLI